MSKLALISILALLSFSNNSMASENQLQEEIKEAKPAAQVFHSDLATTATESLRGITKVLSDVLLFDVGGFPFLVLWLISGGVFLSFYLGFPNLRLFKHAIKVTSGKYDKEDDPGEVSHFGALSAAVSGTVGLGNIAGVAVAVSIGGPGAVFWMVLAGFLGMTTKCAEVCLSMKYRKINENGRVSGGGFYYLKEGLAEKGFPNFGKFLAVVFAITVIGGSIGGGNMFQSNQTVKALSAVVKPMAGEVQAGLDVDVVIAIVIAVAVGLVLLGGIKRIASVAEAVVPLMAILYFFSCATILVMHYENVPAAIYEIISSAFNGQAATGGIIGAMAAGFRRSSFSNEAGLGSAPIAHAAAKTSEPAREGAVALLEPFIDTCVICLLTGIVLVVTGTYTSTCPQIALAGGDIKGCAEAGVLQVRDSFATVSDWFPVLLSAAVALFAYSTLITWGYYGERAWVYLFGSKTAPFFHIIFVVCAFIGGIASLDVVIDFSDALFLSMAVPNLIGVYFLSSNIKEMIKEYEIKLKSGEFDKN
jgi:alanine or glycine:cation symporter, AGCS family